MAIEEDAFKTLKSSRQLSSAWCLNNEKKKEAQKRRGFQCSCKSSVLLKTCVSNIVGVAASVPCLALLKDKQGQG